MNYRTSDTSEAMEAGVEPSWNASGLSYSRTPAPRLIAFGVVPLAATGRDPI